MCDREKSDGRGKGDSQAIRGREKTVRAGDFRLRRVAEGPVRSQITGFREVQAIELTALVLRRMPVRTDEDAKRRLTDDYGRRVRIRTQFQVHQEISDATPLALEPMNPLVVSAGNAEPANCGREWN